MSMKCILCVNSASLAIFKQKIKSWTPVNYPCRLCLNYVEGVGFV